MAVEVIEMDVTWVGIAPIIVAGLEHGTFEGKKIAEGEMMKMALAADQAVELEKRVKELEAKLAEKGGA